MAAFEGVRRSEGSLHRVSPVSGGDGRDRPHRRYSVHLPVSQSHRVERRSVVLTQRRITVSIGRIRRQRMAEGSVGCFLPSRCHGGQMQGLAARQEQPDDEAAKGHSDRLMSGTHHRPSSWTRRHSPWPTSRYASATRACPGSASISSAGMAQPRPPCARAETARIDRDGRRSMPGR